MKSWKQSKTIWWNVCTLGVAVSGVGLQYVGDLGLTDQQAAIAGFSLTTLNTIGNMYLRTITSTAIGS